MIYFWNLKHFENGLKKETLLQQRLDAEGTHKAKDAEQDVEKNPGIWHSGLEAILKNAAESGNCPQRGALGSRFQRYLATAGPEKKKEWGQVSEVFCEVFVEFFLSRVVL